MWSKSILNFNATTCNSKAAKTKDTDYSYQKSCVSQANDLCRGLERPRRSPGEVPRSYNLPTDPGHQETINGLMIGKEKANMQVRKHRTLRCSAVSTAFPLFVR
jgi:hypothetical protein